MTQSAFLAFVVTVTFLLAFRRAAEAFGLVHRPERAKGHGTAVPLIGGVCMAIGLVVGVGSAGMPAFLTPLMLAIFVLVVVGVLDDRFDLPAHVRLIAQTCAALLVTMASSIEVSSLGAPFTGELHLGVFALPFTIVFIVALINAFNLIDGLDGLAAGISLLSLGALAIVGAGTPIVGLIAVLMAVLAAFLLFNLPLGFNHSVRTFMGDAGSTFIGLTIATIGISLSQGEAPKISPINGLWLVALPVFDLYSAILRRSLQGKSPFHGDAGHLHHVLIESGLSRRSALVVMLLLSLGCAAFGILGETLEIAHSVMLTAWFAVGTLYYNVVRSPEWIAAIVAAPAIAKTTLHAASLTEKDRVRPHSSLPESAELSE